jgi:chorismate mutase/prephenate dehydratase
LNLCRIESRPTKDRPWEYAFFVDLMGHQDDEPMREALEALSQELDLMKVLGSSHGNGGAVDLFGCGR